MYSVNSVPQFESRPFNNPTSQSIREQQAWNKVVSAHGQAVEVELVPDGPIASIVSIPCMRAAATRRDFQSMPSDTIGCLLFIISTDSMTVVISMYCFIFLQSELFSVSSSWAMG